jgi:geranylgeranyl diphosphate synthase type II
MRQSVTMMDAAGLLSRSAQWVNEYFGRLRQRYSDAPPRLLEAIEYSLMAGGKRLRPALVFHCAAACSRSANQDVNSSSLPAPSILASAAAMELIHTFSLVHDDLPAMDDDDLRRGRPTNHKVYGEAIAILAGDAMTTIAFEILATDAEPKIAAALIAELARASGPSGMIGGQVIDMDEQKRPGNLSELQHLHRMKTGVLLTASCRMGAIAAGASQAEIAVFDAFGRHLGLAFQIVDDVLDETSTPEQLGKATQKDADKGKVTYPVLIGLDRSRQAAKKQLQSALEAISSLGERAAALHALARFVVEREV